MYDYIDQLIRRGGKKSFRATQVEDFFKGTALEPFLKDIVAIKDVTALELCKLFGPALDEWDKNFFDQKEQELTFEKNKKRLDKDANARIDYVKSDGAVTMDEDFTSLFARTSDAREELDCVRVMKFLKCHGWENHSDYMVNQARLDALEKKKLRRLE